MNKFLRRYIAVTLCIFLVFFLCSSLNFLSVDLVIREFSGTILTGVYIRDVFRTEDNAVVIFFIKDFRNEVDIQIKTGDIYQSLRYSCYYPKCQGTFGQCTFQDFYGAATTDPKELQNGTITVKISEQEIFLQDVRITAAPTHELGVVLQPAYYLADWQNLIQYFESWLAHGATIFYVYYHSWSRQVQAVIEFYKEKLGSGLVILPWSDFPVRTGTNLSNDPNARSFNIVSEAALNNALYRARGTVKYLAMMDLDEIVWISKRKRLIPFLQKMEKENPTTAQFSFPWIHYSAQLQLGQLVRPLEVSFDYLKKLQPIAKTSLDPIYFSTASRKVIHIVDKVDLVDTHNVLKNYIDPDTGKNYTTVMLDSKVAACIHIRRIFNNVSTTEEETSSVLVGHATLLNRKYAKRIRNSPFARLKMSPWFSEYRNTIRTLHACRKVSKLPNATDEGVAQCRSLRACEGFLSGKENYHFAPMSWINLADPTHLQ